MKIIRDRRIVEDDWTRAADDAALPAGKAIVSLDRWLKEKDSLKARGNVGVAIPSALEVHELQADLPSLPLISVSFDFIKPKPEGGRTFDGRAYSQARVLREQLGYQGEIRGTNIFRDAMFYAQRCGVNAFEVSDPEDALNAFKDFSMGYQGAADDPTPIFRRRQP